MAVGTPSVLKDNGAVTTSGQTTVAVTSVVIPANTHVEVLVACSNGVTAVGDPTGTSDGTNNYVKDDSATRSTTVYESIWSFYDSAGGTRTITVTLAAACNYTHVVVTGTSNVASTSALDEIGGGDQGGTTTVAIISTLTVDQADEASLIGLNWATSTALSKWPPTNYTSLFNTTNATRNHSHAGAYRTSLTAGSAETGSNEVILGGATSWAGVLATYKGAAGGSTITFDAAPAGIATITADTVRTLALAALAAGAATATNNDVRTLALAAVVNGTATVIADEVAANRVFAVLASGQASIVATLDSPAGGVTVVALDRDQFAVIHHHHGY